MTQHVDNMRAPTKRWRYFVSDPTKQSWGAVVYIDSSGVFASFSDYGTYGYRWTHPGCDDLREFFVRSGGDWDYYLHKLAPDRRFDVDGTRAAIRDRVCRLRRERRLDKHKAREEWELTGFSNEAEAYAHWFSETHLEDPSDLSRTQYNQQAVMFCKTILPELAKMIEAELAAERALTASVG
jgi:hypothetical protein